MKFSMNATVTFERAQKPEKVEAPAEAVEEGPVPVTGSVQHTADPRPPRTRQFVVGFQPKETS